MYVLREGPRGEERKGRKFVWFFFFFVSFPYLLGAGGREKWGRSEIDRRQIEMNQKVDLWERGSSLFFLRRSTATLSSFLPLLAK